jgi:hypothetical protein
MHEECGVVQMDRGGGAGSSVYLSSAGALCIACPLHGLAGGELVPNPSIRYFLSTLLLVFADFFFCHVCHNSFYSYHKKQRCSCISDCR